jgi:Protein of unknown function (DUF2752)
MIKREEHLKVAVPCAAILTIAWASSATPQNVHLFGLALPSLCGFKLLTTWDCPGCGLTRSLILALHGNFRESFQLHIWGIPLLVVLMFQIPYRIFRYFRPQKAIVKLPASINKWISPAIFLSLMVPWLVKTVAIAIIRYL